MKVAMVCAGFSAGEADQLRRAMATFKHTGGVSKFKDKLVSGMVKNGYSPEFAEKTFSQLEGFGSYGFPESHAASFAPDRLRLELGETPPSGRLLRGSPELPADGFLRSGPDRCRRQGSRDRDQARLRKSVPLGLHRGRRGGFASSRGSTWIADGAGAGDGRRREDRRVPRRKQFFVSADDIWRRSAGVPTASLVKLAEADAFLPSMGLERREALWAIKALRDEPLELWAAAAEREAKAIAAKTENPRSH